MRVLIVSDTHGRHYNFDDALEQVGKIDYLVHLGDVEGEEWYYENLTGCPVYMIAGNNDTFSRSMSQMEIKFGKNVAFMTHGHQYYVSRGIEDILREGKRRGANIIMHGHTHKPYIKEIDGITVINPGSLTLPRQEGRKPSYIVMEIDRMGEAKFEIRYL